MTEVQFVCELCGVMGSADSFGMETIMLTCEICGHSKELTVMNR